MTIYDRILAWVKPDRKPDNTLARDINQPFLRRWYLIPRNPVFEVFLNCFTGSDKLEEKHDHPSFTLSLVLRGRYFEHLDGGIVKERVAGDIILRSPWLYHRVEVLPGEESWSIFLTGPQFWDWGFVTDKGWVSHKERFK